MSIIHPSAAADAPPMPTPSPWGRTFLGLTGGLALALAGAAAQAATLTVTTAGEIADTEPLSRAQCSPAAGDRNCDTLRDAINHAADGDTIVFGAALDGQTISLTRFTNCLDTGQAAGATCLPLASWPGYVSQFGPSAFFISGKHITIDATANGLTPQGVSVQRLGTAPGFRLFDIDAQGGLVLRGLTLAGGQATGGSSRFGGGALGAGGAIFNRGQLTIERSTLTRNHAQGGQGGRLSLNSFAGAGVGEDGTLSRGEGRTLAARTMAAWAVAVAAPAARTAASVVAAAAPAVAALAVVVAVVAAVAASAPATVGAAPSTLAVAQAAWEGPFSTTQAP